MKLLNRNWPPDLWQMTFVLAAASIFLPAGCGGGSPIITPPPTPDFTLSITPVSASAVVGNTTSPVMISVAPQNGFNDSVSVVLQNVPQNVVPSPSSFSLTAGQSQSLAFAVGASATPAISPITLLATSGPLSHSTQLILTTEPVVTASTFQSGSLLYLQSTAGSDVALVGMETVWGGAIVEVSLNGTNFINHHDAGREVQAAQFDAGSSTAAWCGAAWNPTQGGDIYDHGSPVLAQVVTANSIYVKAQGYQWCPDASGGGAGQPILGDTYVEETLTVVTDHANTFKLHIKVTHFGTDQHTNNLQDFPAVYANLEYDRLAGYSGTLPWSNDTVTFSNMTQLGQPGPPPRYSPERWAAFVDGTDFGITVFAPASSPYVAGFAAAGPPGPTGFGTNYFAPVTTYSYGPNSVLEGDAYLIAGDYKHGRQVVYDLHNRITVHDIITPFGAVDQPQPNAPLSGKVDVVGWAFDDSAVDKVNVYVDGILAGTATYGTSRPDIPIAFPNAPESVGFTFALDTHPYPNGSHAIAVRAFDPAGNIAVFPPIPVMIQN